MQAAPLSDSSLCPIYQVFQFKTLATLPKGSHLVAHEFLTPWNLEVEPLHVLGPEYQIRHRTRDIVQTVRCVWRTQIHTHLSENLPSFVKQGIGGTIIGLFTVKFDEERRSKARPFRPKVTLDLANITAKGRSPLDNCARVSGPDDLVNRALRHPLGNWRRRLVKLLRVDINQRRTVMLDRLLQNLG